MYALSSVKKDSDVAYIYVSNIFLVSTTKYFTGFLTSLYMYEFTVSICKHAQFPLHMLIISKLF